MQKRFLSIWFPYLTTDWLTIKRPASKNTAFVFAGQNHGSKVITAMNALAEAQGIILNMPLTDAKAIVLDLQIFDDRPGRDVRLLKGLAEWCIRYAPIVAIDDSQGLFLDISGCAHLWGGETAYLHDIVSKLSNHGYQVRATIADTVGAAWAFSRFAQVESIIESNEQCNAILPLPPAALRLEQATIQRLKKLGLYQIRSFINMPRSVLRRRFGEQLLLRLSQALGQVEEVITPIILILPYHERLPCLEPILTPTGIEIAIKRLLKTLCFRLKEEGNGLRSATLKCYRMDGKVITTVIGTNAASYNADHLFKLFELKIPQIEPALGIELFTLEASKIEEMSVLQEVLWIEKPGLDNQKVTELLDRLEVKIGTNIVHRYLPDEHYWPERSIKIARSINEKASIPWQNDRPRPTQLLKVPEPIEVTAPVPDYPPMLFRYKGKTHHIKKADGPERIEREWWLDKGEHRDYYQVEDEAGQRYWLFRSGHYTGDKSNHWFIHGYFA